MSMSNSAENGSDPIHWVGDAPTSLHGNGSRRSTARHETSTR